MLLFILVATISYAMVNWTENIKIHWNVTGRDIQMLVLVLRNRHSKASLFFSYSSLYLDNNLTTNHISLRHAIPYAG